MTMASPDLMSGVPDDPSQMSYDDFVRLGRGAQSISQFAYGDLACLVATKWGEGRLQEYAADIDIEYNSLRRYRDVARAYESATRVADQSWTVHRALAAQPDRADLLSERKWTKSEAEELVRSRKNPPKPPEDKGGDDEVIEPTSVIPPDPKPAPEQEGKPEPIACDGKRESPAPAIKATRQYLDALLTFRLTARERKTLISVLKKALEELELDQQEEGE